MTYFDILFFYLLYKWLEVLWLLKKIQSSGCHLPPWFFRASGKNDTTSSTLHSPSAGEASAPSAGRLSTFPESSSPGQGAAECMLADNTWVECWVLFCYMIPRKVHELLHKLLVMLYPIASQTSPMFYCTKNSTYTHVCMHTHTHTWLFFPKVNQAQSPVKSDSM